jgi:hypothetical protein
MATDLWPDADGLIADGFTIGFAYADSTSITANYAVKVGTTGASKIPVTVAAAVGDGVAVALKTPVAVGDMIPLCFYGLVKMVNCASGDDSAALMPTIGKFVMNSAALGVQGYRTLLTTNMALFTGASACNILGLCLQTCTAVSDEFAVLVGKCI